jgi:hypothetical protein
MDEEVSWSEMVVQRFDIDDVDRMLCQRLFCSGVSSISIPTVDEEIHAGRT